MAAATLIFAKGSVRSALMTAPSPPVTTIPPRPLPAATAVSASPARAKATCRLIPGVLVAP